MKQRAVVLIVFIFSANSSYSIDLEKYYQKQKPIINNSVKPKAEKSKIDTLPQKNLPKKKKNKSALTKSTDVFIPIKPDNELEDLQHQVIVKKSQEDMIPQAVIAKPQIADPQIEIEKNLPGWKN